MSSRRLPLASNNNAVNSPIRAVGGVLAKHKRSYATTQCEEAYGQPPPAKKQMLEFHQALRTPPRQQAQHVSAEGRVFTRRSNQTQQSAFEKKCVAVREKAQQTVVKGEKNPDDGLEKIRVWQKHYRKQFPTFVFYFESVSEDVRIKYAKQVTSLGAREEKFFSSAVTHVITTRTIPPEQYVAPAIEIPTTSSTANESQTSQPQTINPSLLDRSSESTDLTTKGRFTFEVAPISRRPGAVNGNNGEPKKKPARNADVLYRARELGIKIWALEKIQRMMASMFEETGTAVHGHNTRSNAVQGASNAPGTAREADLQQLLRHERIHGPSDRDPTVATKELNIFKGPYIYIHDIDEKQRPIMVREYPKVANKQDGDWPQFRSVANGKCPFVEEVNYSRREAEKEKEALRLQRQQEKEQSLVPRTRAAAAVQAARMQPPKPISSKRALAEVDHGSNRTIVVPAKQANPFAQVKSSLSHTMEQEAPPRGNAFVSRAGVGRMFGGEPVASGLQPSNVTSAIRSQMISSTAAQPGAKAGTSKEVHGLQRKVLERNSGGPGSFGMTSSHRMTDVSTAAREDVVKVITTKKTLRGKLGHIDEDVEPSEAEENARSEAARKAKAAQRAKLEKRDPKPGYCENCQEKFDDFDEHVSCRKHRKFAERSEPWEDLDDLLRKLTRPLAPREDEETEEEM